MIDVIGFWATVTLASITLLSPAILVGIFLLTHLLEQVFEGDEERVNKITSKFYQDESEDYIIFLGVKMSYVIFVGTPVVGVIFNIITAVIYLTHDHSYVYMISLFANFLAPAMGWVVILVSAYIGTIYAGRALVRTIDKVTALAEKVEQLDKEK